MLNSVKKISKQIADGAELMCAVFGFLYPGIEAQGAELFAPSAVFILGR